MSTQALLSVVVPVYNVKDYLPQCIESIINQSYKNLEIILVNDGSTDGSGEVCDAYAQRDSRIKVIHKPNGGLSSARNAGMAVMNGDFVAFVDSDDWLELDAYELCMKPFLDDPSLDVVRAEYQECYPDRTRPNISPFKTACTLNQDELFTIFTHTTPGECLFAVVWSSVYRISRLRAIKLQFLEGLYHEDEYFTSVLYGCLPSIKLRYLPNIIYNYRQAREGAITQQKTLKHLEHLVIGYGQVYSAFEEQNNSTRLTQINAYIMNSLDKAFIQTLETIPMSDLLRTIAPLCQKARTIPLPKRRDTWLTKLFIYSPKISYYFGRVYQPIARRLGISERYK